MADSGDTWTQTAGASVKSTGTSIITLAGRFGRMYRTCKKIRLIRENLICVEV